MHRTHPSLRKSALELGAELGGQDGAAALDEQGHLVADETDVAVRGGHDGETRSVGDAGDEQERVGHLDDALVHGAASEAVRRPRRRVR